MGLFGGNFLFINRNSIVIYVGVILFILFCKTTEAQPFLKFQHLNSDNGLSQNSVLAIGQDANGFIWLGTQNGLNKYDGYSIKTFYKDGANTKSLTDNYILSIFNDSKSRLWIGTLNGLNLYHPQSESFTRYDIPFRKVNPRFNDINFIAEDNTQLLWIGTKLGLLTFVPEKKLFTKIILPKKLSKPEISFNDAYVNQDSSLWLATSVGLFILKKKSTTEFSIKAIEISTINQEEFFCTSIVKGLDNTFWVGTLNNGLFQIDQYGKVIYHFNLTSRLDNHIRKLIVDKFNNVLVATQGGLFELNQTSKSVIQYKHKNNDPQSLGKNSLYGLFEDNTGSIWAGSYFGGVSFASKANSQFFSWPGPNQLPGIENPVISEITLDKNHTLWMGAEGNGLIHFNPQNKQYEVFRNSNSALKSDLVKAVYFDKHQKLWIGTHGAGINIMDIDSKSFSWFPIEKNENREKRSETYCFAEDNEGHMLLGGNYGIKKINLNKGTADMNSVQDIFKPVCRTITVMSNGRIFAGTTKGLYDIANGTLKLLIKELDINCLLEIASDKLLIGSKSGLYQYNIKTSELTPISVGSKSNMNVLSIGKSSTNNVWISTENGLYNIPMDNSLGTKQYLVSDGIANNQFNYNSAVVDNKGFLYFGGNDGLTYFQQKDITSNNRKSNLFFTGFRFLDTSFSTKGNKSIQNLNDSGAVIKLRYDQSSFSLSFALLNFIKPEKNHFKYKLLGYDKEWREVKEPVATFINLAPGNYTLQIQGFNNDNVPSVVKQLSIVVQPPFWQTWWAFAIYFLLLTILIFAITRYFFLKAVYEREETLNQQKLRFFTNISHEIRTHLTLIVSPLTYLLQKDNTLNENKTLGQIQSNAYQLMNLVNELMDFRKVEENALILNLSTTKLQPFIIKIYQSFLPIAEINNIDFSFDFQEAESLIVSIDKTQMEKVFFNLLSNAFKFTPQNGKIKISANKVLDKVVIKVSDNGLPIDPIYNEKIFDNYFQIKDQQENKGFGIGLAYAKKIVELHQGTISLQDAKDGDFTKSFFVQIHISPDHPQKNIRVLTSQETDFVDPIPEGESDLATSLPYDKDKPDLMIVEDNKKIQILLSEILSKEYNLIIADCAEEAFVLLEENIPDIFLSDVMMPGMGGIEFCKKIKQDIKTSHIPLVLLTAKNAEEDLIDGLENGADVYLSKPFNTQVLELNIRNLLQRQSLLQRRVTETLAVTGHNDQDGKESLIHDKLDEIEDLHPKDQIFLNELILFVDRNMENKNLGVQLMTKEFAMSTTILYKKIQALTGYTIHEFIKLQRLKKACVLLKDGAHNITEVAYLVGYSDRKYFSKEFKKVYGVAPTSYQENGTIN